MIYARQNRYGILWKFHSDSIDELIRVEKAVRSKYGADILTGKVFCRTPMIDGLKRDQSIPPGFWFLEFRAPDPQGLLGNLS